MKKMLYVALIVLAVLAGVGVCCGQQVKSKAFQLMIDTLLSHSVTEITVDQAVALPDDVLFLDAREEKEFKVSRIADAQWVGFNDFDTSRVANINKDRPVVVYCSVGYRSEKVSEQLEAAGFTNVSNLYGGIFEWKNSGQPVVNNKGETEKVHAYDRVWGIWLNEGKKVFK